MLFDFNNISAVADKILEQTEGLIGKSTDVIVSFLRFGLNSCAVLIPVLILLFVVATIVFKRNRPGDLAVSALFLIWDMIFNYLRISEGANHTVLYLVWGITVAFYAIFASFAVMWFKSMSPEYKPSPFRIINDKIMEWAQGPFYLRKLKNENTYNELADKYLELKKRFDKLAESYNLFGAGGIGGNFDGIDYTAKYFSLKKSLKEVEPKFKEVMDENNSLKAENSFLKTELEKYRPEDQG